MSNVDLFYRWKIRGWRLPKQDKWRWRRDRTGQDRTGQDKPSQDKPRQAKPSQAKPRQDKTRQDKTRQDKTREDKTKRRERREEKKKGREEKRREEKRREKRRWKCRRWKRKREREHERVNGEIEMKENMFFYKTKVSEPSNPADELAQNVSKNTFRTNSSSISLRKFRNWPCFQLFTWFGFDFAGRGN